MAYYMTFLMRVNNLLFRKNRLVCAFLYDTATVNC